MARVAPASWSFWAMPQAMERLLASPKTTAVLPAKLIMLLECLQLLVPKGKRGAPPPFRITEQICAPQSVISAAAARFSRPRSINSTCPTGRPRKREPSRSNFSTESVAKQRTSVSLGDSARARLCRPLNSSYGSLRQPIQRNRSPLRRAARRLQRAAAAAGSACSPAPACPDSCLARLSLGDRSSFR